MAETPARKQTPAKATPPAATEANTPGVNQREDEQTASQQQGIDQVVEGAEHVLGKDDRREVSTGFHDSITGRPLDAQGNFQDNVIPGQESAVEPHRIVADNWPELQQEEDAKTVERHEAEQEKADKDA